MAQLIPLPPLEEQRRIVARIEELMGRVREARRLREEARNEAERLWQAILAQTFPRPGSELPEGWRWAKLGEIATVFSGTWGKDPSSQGSDEEALVRVIRVSDIKETLTIDYASVPWRCVTQKEVKRLALRDGDVIVVKSSGSQAKVISGRAALFRQQPEIFLPSNFVFAVRCNEKEVDPRFLWCWLNSEPVKQAIKQMVATFTYPNLKKSDYAKLPIPLPPLEEQRRIVVHLQEVQEKIKALKEAQEQTEAELKRLEQAILEKAFRGEL
jgi:type I restriction enzyme S subunit